MTWAYPGYQRPMETDVIMTTVKHTWPEIEKIMRNRAINTDERLGQAYFHALWIMYPEIANLVRGTDADPFHCDTFQDPRFVAFFDVIIPYFAGNM